MLLVFLDVCALWSPAGKGWPLGSRLWCLPVSWSLSHLYPGSGVLLDCIDSWSLHPYLLKVRTVIESEVRAARGNLSKDANRYWVDHQVCSPSHYINVITNLFYNEIFLINCDEKILVPTIFFNLYTKSP